MYRKIFMVLLALIGPATAELRQPGLPEKRDPAQSMYADQLHCEYRTDPLGINSEAPNLSWIVISPRRGAMQTAYRILAASDPLLLKPGQADLWDSGRVESDATIDVAYQGVPLSSGQSCWWTVQVWDQDHTAGSWSQPAHWSMGLLRPDDWKAKWIGYYSDKSPTVVPDSLQSARWITPATEIGRTHDVYFRYEFELPAGQVDDARAFLTSVDYRMSLYVNGEYAAVSRQPDAVFEYSFPEHLRPGRNVLYVQVHSYSDGPRLIGGFDIRMMNGRTLHFSTGKNWCAFPVENEESAGPAVSENNRAQVNELEKYEETKPGVPPIKRLFLPGARYLRTQFTAEKPVTRAMLYSTALGIYRMQLNGQRVGQDWLSPGWTDYSTRVYYRSYDVTDLIQPGENVLAARLSDGWFAGYVGYTYLHNNYHGDARLKAQLEIEYADGSRETVASGPDWRASSGPVREADLLMGETYDARMEMPGWDKAGFDAGPWDPVATGSSLSPRLQAAVNQPVVVFKELEPVSITEPEPNIVVVDLGQNFAGVVRVKLRGQRGQKIRFLYGERLLEDGTVYTENMRNARATDTYICKGDGIEEWTPSTTFHGFQYVEIHGLSSPGDLISLTGLALGSDTPETGHFACDNAMINQLYSNIRWTQRMNFISVPTDCPQRDERLGWTGDAQVYIGTACLNNDVHAFFRKWLTDLMDAQREDGDFPPFAPWLINKRTGGGPAWSDAGVICPWMIYQMYGDRRILESCYPHMKKFIAFTRKRVTPELLPPETFRAYGDWLNVNDDTPKDVIFMAYWALSTKLTAQIADVLGHKNEADEYTKLFLDIKAAFNRAYVGSDGRIKGDSQTAYALALVCELLDGQQRQQAADHLVRRIEEANVHLSTGFIGTKDLMLALADIGRNDLAWKLLYNKSYPSWGFSVAHGATTIWEHWDGWTQEKGFWNPAMNSFAHYSFGAVAQWMFENIGGIQRAEPAYKKIVIKPSPDPATGFAETAYDSVRGRIATRWEHLDGGGLRLAVDIPANTTALVHMPAKSADSVCESGLPANESEGVTFMGMQEERAVYRIGSGSYVFEAK